MRDAGARDASAHDPSCSSATTPLGYLCFIDTGDALPRRPGRPTITSFVLARDRIPLDDIPAARRAAVGWCPDASTELRCHLPRLPLIATPPSHP